MVTYYSRHRKLIQKPNTGFKKHRGIEYNLELFPTQRVKILKFLVLKEDQPQATQKIPTK